MKELPFFRHNVTIRQMMLKETVNALAVSLSHTCEKEKRFYGSYNQRR